MDYFDQLNSEKWNDIANKVHEKNNYHCELCGSNDELHVHHKLYRARKKVWEYDLDDLMLLCKKCHGTEHDNGIPVYNEVGRLIKTLYADREPCPRCGGRGIFPQYMHIQHGICFLCWGHYFYPIDFELYSIEYSQPTSPKSYKSFSVANR